MLYNYKTVSQIVYRYLTEELRRIRWQRNLEIDAKNMDLPLADLINFYKHIEHLGFGKIKRKYLSNPYRFKFAIDPRSAMRQLRKEIDT